FKIKTDILSDLSFLSGMNHPFVAIFIITNDFIVNPSKELTINIDNNFTFFYRCQFQIFWTNNDFNTLSSSNPCIRTFKFFTDNLNFVVFYHRSSNNVTFTNKVCNKAVNWLIVNIYWRSTLDNFPFIHNKNPITHRQCFFLIVSNENKGNAQT